MKNETKNDKVFSNYKVDNAIGVQVVDDQSERNCSVKGKMQRKKSYAEILKMDGNTANKLEQNRNERTIDVVDNTGCFGVDFKVSEPILTSRQLRLRMRYLIHRKGDFF